MDDFARTGLTEVQQLSKHAAYACEQSRKRVAAAQQRLRASEERMARSAARLQSSANSLDASISAVDLPEW